MSVSFALIAEVVRVDEKPLVYEDVLEMDLDDVLTLEAEVMGVGDGRQNFQPTPTFPKETGELLASPQSSDLSPSASPLQNLG